MRIGIIGFGYWGKILSRCFSEISGLDVFCIADTAPDRCEEARMCFPCAMVVSNHVEILSINTIDAIVIATPADTHYSLAKSSFEAGKHVWVEKPVAATADEAKILALLAQRCGRVLFIDHTYLYSAAIKMIQQILTQKELGCVHCYESVRFNNGQPRTDASIFHDLAIHDVAILDLLIGEFPLAVSSKNMPTTGVATPVAYSISLVYASGFKAVINVNWCAPVKIRRILIGSSRQIVSFDDLEVYNKVRLYELPLLEETSGALCDFCVELKNSKVLSLHSQKETLSNAIECFLNYVQMGVRPLSDGWQGVRVAAVVEACLASAESNGCWKNVAPVN